jgi:integrase
MKGKIGYAPHVKRFYVSWYDSTDQKTYKVYQYKGFKLSSRDLAEKLLASMQGDVEKGVFRIEAYTKAGGEVVPYLRQWLKAIKGTITPATYKDYDNSIENHLVPFFETKPSLQLHEIRFDTNMELLAHIGRAGHGKQNVMYCLHACLDYAWRAGRIGVVPPFPRKRDYNIIEQPIVWLPEIRQKRVIEALPRWDQPIFWWLKLNVRRPAEAMALYKTDFNGEVFIVHRSFSSRELINKTKTGEVHHVPLVDEFAQYIDIEREKQLSLSIVSPYFFVNPRGKTPGKPYTHKALSDLWHAALEKTGESIRLYQGMKHSTCSQYINECGYSIYDVQMATDHATLASVKKYGKVEVSTRKALLEKRVVRFPNPVTNLERKGER